MVELLTTEPTARAAGRRTLLAAALAAPVAMATSGCAFDVDRDYREVDAPSFKPLARKVRVAWVLGSGGPRGFVHVGVLKALDELGLAPDLIVGASVGALVGTLKAGGISALAIETMALDLQPMTLGRLAIGAEETLSGAPLAAWVQEQLGQRPLEALPVPVACVAVRLADQAVVPLTAGNAGLAVQASAAIQGRFAPVRILGQRYVDPDLFRPLPVREARLLGAQRVLAIDASAHEDRAPESARRFRETDLRKRGLTRPDAVAADLLLHPDFGYWVSLSREFRERAIESGYRATLAQARALRALHAG